MDEGEAQGETRRLSMHFHKDLNARSNIPRFLDSSSFKFYNNHRRGFEHVRFEIFPTLSYFD